MPLRNIWKQPKRWVKEATQNRDAGNQDETPESQGVRSPRSPADLKQQLVHRTEVSRYTPEQHPSPGQAVVNVSSQAGVDVMPERACQPTTASRPSPSDPAVEIRAQEPPAKAPAPYLSPSQSLWNEAYDSLENDKEAKKLVQLYLETVIKAIQANPEDTTVSADDLKDPRKRQRLMEKLIEDGREKVAKASKVTKGIGDFAGAILSVKPMVDAAIQNIPYAAPAALPWAGVCAGLQASHPLCVTSDVC